MTEKMKALVFTGKEQVSILELDKPVITSNEILLETKAVALCTVEQRAFKSDNEQYSLIGHEVSGIVKEIGADVRGFEIGDKVVSTFQYCGYCENCKKGRGEKCLNSRTQKKRIIDDEIRIGNGGMAQYAAVPATQITKVGENVSFEHASLTEPLACCLHSVERAKPEFGETAVVIGAGIMGIFHTRLLKMQGCRVIVSEMDESRRQVALDSGANLAVDPSKVDIIEYVKSVTDGQGADIVVNTTSIYQVGEQGVEMLAPYGRYIAYASLHPSKPVAVDFGILHSKETELIGTVSPRAIDFLKAATLMKHELIDVENVIHKVYDFEDGQTAFEDAIKPTYRCIIKY